MTLSRRDFVRFTAGTGALAALGQLGRTSAMAAPVGTYRAMVGVFLLGGNDGWNMVIPTDARHAAYLASRGPVGLPASALKPLTNSTYALHPAMAALRPLWDEGSLALVLNTGTLFAPLTKATYNSRPDLRPSNLMSHSDEQGHWQGMSAREGSSDGFMGRIADRMTATPTPSLISLAGSTLAILGRQSSALAIPSTGAMTRSGVNPAQTARNNAVTALADGASYGTITDATGRSISASYAQANTANTILAAASSVENYFLDPVTKAPLTSDIARQLIRVARMIEARGSLGHARQTFFVAQGGYDNHSGQVVVGNPTAGVHAGLLGELAVALTCFHRAMQAMGMAQNVTAFTMSDFGRSYRGNAQGGTDHAWGNNHLVVGGNVKPGGIFGTYPDPTLGGANDIDGLGRFIPTIAQEEYVGAIARWHGVAAADMPYVFPNWTTWSTGGRAPLGLFRV